MKEFNRRNFLKLASGGAAVIYVGCSSSGGGGGGVGVGPGPDGGGNPGPNPQISETLDFTITDAVKEMVTHEPNSTLPNPAECYFWVFKENRFPHDVPGPQIFAVQGDLIRLKVKNELEGKHSFVIPGMVDTGPIDPGASVDIQFTVGLAGAYLYYDGYNDPVGRVMGLHGAFIVMPKTAAVGHNFTPYSNPTPGVQQLFDDFGSTAWWPGLSWEAGDDANNTPAFRQHVWLDHQASPVLFDEVGTFCRNNPGLDFDAQDFIEAFINDPFINTSNDPRSGTSGQHPVKFLTHNRKPQYFTINGQSGFFSHFNPAITPMYRVGEPCVIHLLNAGLWTHSMHLHCNHMFITSVGNIVQENPIWVDVFNLLPMRGVDYVVPFMKPPDIPNARGIGRADAPLATQSGGVTWPPVEELERMMPALGAVITTNYAGNGTVDMMQAMTPLCYPMHDHSEPSQTAQGGNYNCGLISGMYIIGDRNTPGHLNFNLDPDFQMLLGFGRKVKEDGPPTGGWPAEDVA